MKLYTEEQVHNTVKSIQDYLDHYDEKEAQEKIEKHLKALKPIELPSDEEIQNMGKDVIVYNDTKRGWFVEGLRFMRDKIQGGNK